MSLHLIPAETKQSIDTFLAQDPVESPAFGACTHKEKRCLRKDQRVDRVVDRAVEEEMKDAGEKKDWCREELHKHEMATTAKYEDKEDAETTIVNHEANGARLKEETAAAQADIKQTQVDIKQASENR